MREGGAGAGGGAKGCVEGSRNKVQYGTVVGFLFFFYVKLYIRATTPRRAGMTEGGATR